MQLPSDAGLTERVVGVAELLEPLKSLELMESLESIE